MATYDSWSDALELELRQPFPAEYVQSKRMGGRAVSFVPWWRYADRLDELVGGGWSDDATEIHIKDKLIVRVVLTIFGSSRVSYGDEDDSEYEEVADPNTGELVEKKTMYGSPITNAERQAFKRACAKFGLGRYLYNKSVSPAQHARQAEAARPRDVSGGQRDPAIEKARGLCKGKLNTAATVGVISVDEAARVERAIDSHDLARIVAADGWLETRIAGARMGATSPYP